MLRTIRLRGELGKRFGRIHKLAVDTPAEAIRALIVNNPSIKDFLIESDARGVGYRCTADGTDIDQNEMETPLSRSFSITPVVSGAGSILKIIAGAVLIGLAVGAFGMFAPFAGSLVAGMLGGALVLSGVAGLLAPTPTAQQGQANDNKYFDGPQQTVQQGTVVPVGYGRLIIGSKVISAGITVEDQYTQYSQYGPYMGNFSGDRRYDQP